MIGLVNSNSLYIPLADRSVHCVVTSPPYYGLRDYGTAKWKGGDDGCEHSAARHKSRFDYPLQVGNIVYQGDNVGSGFIRYDRVCPDCGAVRVDSQLGLEETPDEYVGNMVNVFREVWRVLRDDGTVWLNLGDSYATSPPGNKTPPKDIDGNYKRKMERQLGHGEDAERIYRKPKDMGMKPKDLMGIPWRVAFALQSDGWYLRSDIIWNKTNPMPESVTDRPTKSHEYIFLLSKSSRYYYDSYAILEEAVWTSKELQSRRRGFAKKNNSNGDREQHHGNQMTGRTMDGHSGPFDSDGKIRATMVDKLPARNKRSVWTVSTKPYKGAHFATYPPDLIEPCIKAGTSEMGCCPKCGAQWERVVEKNNPSKEANIGDDERYKGLSNMGGNHQTVAGLHRNNGGVYASGVYVGWKTGCGCMINGIVPDPVPSTVFDPFVGSGTTLLVARNLERNGVGLDVSYSYLHEQARIRLELDKLKFA